MKGTHTPEDDILMHKKAHALVNCYIDSAVSPRVQINVPQELVGHILDSMSQGVITRGLFHEAALNIFSVLILYWKKFCLARFAPKRRRLAVNSASSLHYRQGATAGHEEHREWHAFFGGIRLYHNNYYTPCSLSLIQTVTDNYTVSIPFLYTDGGPILSYSLSHGIRWFYPGANQHYHIEHHQQRHKGSNAGSERQSQMLTT